MDPVISTSNDDSVHARLVPPPGIGTELDARIFMHIGGHLLDQRSLWTNKVRDTSEQGRRRHLPENTLNSIDDKELAGRCGTHVPIRWDTGAIVRLVDEH